MESLSVQLGVGVGGGVIVAVGVDVGAGEIVTEAVGVSVGGGVTVAVVEADSVGGGVIVCVKDAEFDCEREMEFDKELDGVRGTDGVGSKLKVAVWGLVSVPVFEVVIEDVGDRMHLRCSLQPSGQY